MLTAGLLLGAARGLHMAASFSLFGTCLMAAALLPNGVELSLRRLIWGSFALLATAGGLWFVLETADMSGAQDFADFWAALPLVAGQTRFGELLIGRGVLCLLAALWFHFGYRRCAAVLAGAAVMAEAWLGHGGAMTGAVGSILLLSSICHLLCGSAWLGSLPALHAGIRALPIAQAARLARRVSPIGVVCVLGLILSAIVQYVYLIGGSAALVNTSYGLAASFKILCLSMLILLASINRARLTPKICSGDEIARRHLMFNISAEILIGLLVVLAAGFLLQQTPPAMATMLKQQGGG